MKKIFMIAAAGILFFALTGEVKAYNGPPGFEVDRNPVAFNEAIGFPYISETGRTMMPVNACLTSIGCYVAWDNQTKTVFSYKDNMQVEIPVGKKHTAIRWTGTGRLVSYMRRPRKRSRFHRTISMEGRRGYFQGSSWSSADSPVYRRM